MLPSCHQGDYQTDVMSQQASIASTQSDGEEPQMQSERAHLRLRRRTWLETWGGSWCAEVYERFNSHDGGASDFPASGQQNGYGCRILLRFSPGERVAAKKIGLVQRTTLSFDGVSEDEGWAQRYRDAETRATLTDAELCKHTRSNGTSHIDRKIYLRNPVYGAPDAQNVAQTPGGGLRRHTVWRGHATPEVKTQYQLGYRKPLPLLPDLTKEARLFDQPFVPGNSRTTRHEFETVAVELQACESSSGQGSDGAVKYYGSVSWGYEIVGGHVHLLPFAVHSYEHASREMQQCIRAWNDALPEYRQDNHPRVRNVQLPAVPDV